MGLFSIRLSVDKRMMDKTILGLSTYLIVVINLVTILLIGESNHTQRDQVMLLLL